MAPGSADGPLSYLSALQVNPSFCLTSFGLYFYHSLLQVSCLNTLHLLCNSINPCPDSRSAAGALNPTQTTGQASPHPVLIRPCPHHTVCTPIPVPQGFQLLIPSILGFSFASTHFIFILSFPYISPFLLVLHNSKEMQKYMKCYQIWVHFSFL